MTTPIFCRRITKATPPLPSGVTRGACTRCRHAIAMSEASRTFPGAELVCDVCAPAVLDEIAEATDRPIIVALNTSAARALLPNPN